MKRLNDYDEYGQAIPRNKKMEDLESHRLHTLGVRYVTWKEFVAMQDALTEIINEQTTILQKMLIELRQSKLHLASLSDESIDEESIRGED